MAEFCKSCALDTWGESVPSDFAGLCGLGEQTSVLCEGCGWIWVDSKGARIEKIPGTGYLDVTTRALPHVLSSLPSSYRVAGSMQNAYPETVRLLLESSDLHGNVGALQLLIEDAGSTRTVRITRNGSVVDQGVLHCGGCNAIMTRGEGGAWSCPSCWKHEEVAVAVPVEESLGRNVK